MRDPRKLKLTVSLFGYGTKQEYCNSINEFDEATRRDINKGSQ